MRLISKSRYAVTAMLNIALHYKQGFRAARRNSGVLKISLSYFEQLFSRLRKHELVASVGGLVIGCLLSRDSNLIAVGATITDDGGIDECHQIPQGKRVIKASIVAFLVPFVATLACALASFLITLY